MSLKKNLDVAAQALINAGNSVKEYMASLEQIGVDLDQAQYPTVITEVALTVAIQAMRETLRHHQD